MGHLHAMRWSSVTLSAILGKVVSFHCVPVPGSTTRYFHSDNMAVVSVMSTRMAKSDGLMHLLRCISFYGALYSFRVSCVHVPGAINDAADALSRDNMFTFSALLPQAAAVPVPPPLVGLLVSVRQD